MTKEEAIKWLTNEKWGNANNQYKREWNEAFDMAIEALSAEPSKMFKEFYDTEKGETMSDLIKREDAIGCCNCHGSIDCTNRINALPSADAEQGWRIGKPTERGEYIVTVDSMRHGMVELMYYGKPLMPNRKVKGICWYRSDDEWGDVVYDDADILAWMPLPKPYREESEVEE